MARLVVRNVDKLHAVLDPYQDVKTTKRGMVIDILEDGQGLGAKGGRYLEWTVVEVPGVVPGKLGAYLTPEPGDPATDKMLQRRAFLFDLDAWARDGAKSLTLQQADGYRVEIEKRDDPLLVG